MSDWDEWADRVVDVRCEGCYNYYPSNQLEHERCPDCLKELSAQIICEGCFRWTELVEIQNGLCPDCREVEAS